MSVMALLARVAAKSCRSTLSGFSKGLFCGVLQPGWLQSCIGAKRHLLSENALKLQDFQHTKLDVARKITGSEGNNFELIKQKMQGHKLILREDLKLLLYLCETPEDMQIAREAIYRYHTENHNMLHGDYRFGTIFMRLCYELGLEELAAATITDEKMKGFFLDKTSFNIAIDLLFLKGSYERAMDVLRTMSNQGIQFNKDTVVLATGTYYKLNTADSYRNCIDLIEEQQTKGCFIPRHAYCFAVALALKQNDLEKARLLYSQIFKTDNKMCSSFKVIIQAMSGEISEAVSVLCISMYPESRFFEKKPEFTRDAVDFLRLQANGTQLQMKVEQIVTELEQAGQVTDETLDEMLCRTPSGKKPPVRREEPKTSTRTLMPLQPLWHTLFSE
ncbi:pentatricopeptide repeat-containing protein 2, mitochondrial [Austrofundulus limnaeus]|uniref:Pentatricopeptide repeat-containing protein 2, mitochondrial n=1 Tax=Austrofundulus limnaeus TaxID=52670 RepID=A0A2I4B2V8_AUSLI|nr:PREDICTED: pentatricopeptide repeat-containing protein 2, mitochondrial [Austrofundulus limnaeus]